MPSISEIEDWQGRQVVGPDGEKIGKIDEIYLDESSGEPEWALVNTGLFGLKSSFVLIADATTDGGDVTVPFDKATVKDAPNIDPEGQLSGTEESALYEYYGRGSADAASTGATPGAPTPAYEEPPAPEGAVTEVDGVVSPAMARADKLGDSASDASTPAANAGEIPERWGPQGPTGRSDTEDPVPPDGGAPPNSQQSDHPPGTPQSVRDGASDADGERVAGTADEPDEVPGEHWAEEALPEEGNATATPEHQDPDHPAPDHNSERDALEAPEDADAPGPVSPSTGDGTGRSRMRKYVKADADEGMPPDPHPHGEP